MSRAPLMPKATAVWLVENTPLTFEQIAEFCGLHVLEVKGIADGDVAQGIKGMDPISSGQLTREEISRAIEDSSFRLRISEPKTQIPVVKTKKGPRYTPVSRRQDRPNAVLWLLRHHPELKESQIMRLVGTTKPTIHAIRERTHWNSANLQPADPVTLGLCTQIDLDREVRRAAKRVERERKEAEKAAIKAGTLLPAEVTTAEPAKPRRSVLVTAAEHAARKAATEEAAMLVRGLAKPDVKPEKSEKQEKARRLEEALSEAESVFGKLKPMRRDEE
ncbi:MAG: DUF1013 domain-containing protein [Hyphomicrobiales bacterium]